jgi:hypothetical protein
MPIPFFKNIYLTIGEGKLSTVQYKNIKYRKIKW